MWQMLVGPIAEIINKVLGRVLPPEKMSEAERAQVESQIMTEILKADWSFVEKQAQIIIAEAQGGSWLQRSWRPILMLCIVGIVANNYILFPYLSLFTSKATMLQLPNDLWNLLNIGVGGYIIGRSAEKIVGNLKSKV